MMFSWLSDPSIAVALIALIGAALSLMGTIFMAQANIRSSQLNASDKIAIGSGELIDSYREERKANREEIANLSEMVITQQEEMDRIKNEMIELRQWRSDVNEFIVPFIEGSKRNERQLLEANLVPAYKLPPMPEWLKSEKDDIINPKKSDIL